MRLLFCSNSISPYYRRHFHTGGDFAPEITQIVAYLLRHIGARYLKVSDVRVRTDELFSCSHMLTVSATFYTQFLYRNYSGILIVSTHACCSVEDT